MDWPALGLSLRLGALTVAVLVPLAILAGRLLAYARFRGRGWVEALAALPLVLPPTVLGFYLLALFGARSGFGAAWESWFGHSLAFSFQGLLVASVLANIPFAVQPIQRAFETVPTEQREAAQVCGLTAWTQFLAVELPLAWPGIATAAVLVFAHTLGEFGVVLMIGGAIPEETRTISIAIYDRMQAFDTEAAGAMAAALLGMAFATLGAVHALTNRLTRRR